MSLDDDLYGQPVKLPEESERPKQKSKYRKARKRIIAITSIILLVILLLIVSFVIQSKDTGDESRVTNPSSDAIIASDSTDNALPNDDIPQVNEKVTFKANRPRLSIEHPTSWNAIEENAGVKVLSPKFSFETTSGQIKNGYFKIYIRQGARQEDSSYIGSGVASLASEILKYSDPAPGQREETNLSFFGLDGKDHFAYFFIAGNFSLNPGDTLGPDYGNEPGTYIVSGGYSSDELEDDLATHKVSLDYFNKTKVYNQALDIIKSLQLF